MRINYIRKDLQYLFRNNIRKVLHYSDATIEELAKECGLSRVGMSQIFLRCNDPKNPGIGGIHFLSVLYACYFMIAKRNMDSEIKKVCIKMLDEVRDDYLEKGFYEQKGDIPDEQ